MPVRTASQKCGFRSQAIRFFELFNFSNRGQIIPVLEGSVDAKYRGGIAIPIVTKASQGNKDR